MNEREMRWALGINRKAAPGYQVPKIRVKLSVRKGGPAFVFEHVEPTVSELQAWTEAHKAARKEGLTVWCVLEVERV